MKKIVSYFALILAWTCNLSGAENLTGSAIVSSKCVKRSGLGKRITSNVNNGSDKSHDSILTPKNPSRNLARFLYPSFAK